MAERKEAHRARLLETAVREFGRSGYHATTVPMIVRASGSSTGSFYFYFRNKEDVFAAALEAFEERIARELNRAMAAAGANLAAQMRAAVERMVLLLAENPSEARILVVESSGLSERLQQVRRRIVDSHARSVEMALERMRAEGARVGAGIDLGIAARCWVGSAYEAVFHWLEQDEKDRPAAEDLAQAVADFNLRAVGALGEEPRRF
jgi:TetR/AcrR family transcriptional regulator, fatty acid metabolism regulator protein